MTELPTSRPRIDSITCVTGLIATHPCSQSGSVDAGTKVDEPNVSGNTSRNDSPCTAPELRASIPTSTETQLSDTAKVIMSTTAISTKYHGVWNRNPIATPNSRLTPTAML